MKELAPVPPQAADSAIPLHIAQRRGAAAAEH